MATLAPSSGESFASTAKLRDARRVKLLVVSMALAAPAGCYYAGTNSVPVFGNMIERLYMLFQVNFCNVALHQWLACGTDLDL